MSRNETEEYGIQLAKFGLLMDRTSSIYLNVSLLVSSSAMLVVVLYKLCLMRVKEKIDKE